MVGLALLQGAQARHAALGDIVEDVAAEETPVAEASADDAEADDAEATGDDVAESDDDAAEETEA